MSKIKSLLPEDFTIQTVEPEFEETPVDARNLLIDIVSIEKAEREWTLSKYSDAEIKAEYLKRFPF